MVFKQENVYVDVKKFWHHMQVWWYELLCLVFYKRTEVKRAVEFGVYRQHVLGMYSPRFSKRPYCLKTKVYDCGTWLIGYRLVFYHHFEDAKSEFMQSYD